MKCFSGLAYGAGCAGAIFFAIACGGHSENSEGVNGGSSTGGTTSTAGGKSTGDGGEANQGGQQGQAGEASQAGNPQMDPDASAPMDASIPMPDAATPGVDAAVSYPDASVSTPDAGVTFDAGSGGGGMDAGPMCGGTATACADFMTTETCITQFGCFIGGVCVAEGFDGGSCASYDDETACTSNGCSWKMPCQSTVDCTKYVQAQPCNLTTGCEWNVSSMTCEITPQTCGVIASEASCTNAIGCAWTAEYFACVGTATECSAFDVGSCTSQDGCLEP